MIAEIVNYIGQLESIKKSSGIFLLFICYLLLHFAVSKQIGNKKFVLFWGSLVGLIICPITGVFLLKIFSGFYDVYDLVGIVPWGVMFAVFVCILYVLIKQENKGNFSKKNDEFKKIVLTISLIIVGASFLGNLTFFEGGVDAKEGMPKFVYDTLDSLKNKVKDEELLIVSPREIQTYIRHFDEGWTPMYGRDLWDKEAARYISSSYDKEYEYFNFVELSILSAEQKAEFTNLMQSGQANCYILKDEFGYILQEIQGFEKVELNDSYTAYLK